MTKKIAVPRALGVGRRASGVRVSGVGRGRRAGVGRFHYDNQKHPMQKSTHNLLLCSVSYIHSAAGSGSSIKASLSQIEHLQRVYIILYIS